jgi:hypothetical protein
MNRTIAFQQGQAIGRNAQGPQKHSEETSCRVNPHDRGTAEWHEWYAGWYLEYRNGAAAEAAGRVSWYDAWLGATDLGRYLIARVEAYAQWQSGTEDWRGDIAFSWSCVSESEAYEDDKLLEIIGGALTPEAAIAAVTRDLLGEEVTA